MVECKWLAERGTPQERCFILPPGQEGTWLRAWEMLPRPCPLTTGSPEQAACKQRTFWSPFMPRLTLSSQLHYEEGMAQRG